jgi:hypothetical protein
MLQTLIILYCLWFLGLPVFWYAYGPIPIALAHVHPFVQTYSMYACLLTAILGQHKKNPMVMYTVKKVIDFPVPSRNVTNQTLTGRE